MELARLAHLLCMLERRGKTRLPSMKLRYGEVIDYRKLIKDLEEKLAKIRTACLAALSHLRFPQELLEIFLCSG